MDIHALGDGCDCARNESGVCAKSSRSFILEPDKLLTAPDDETSIEGIPLPRRSKPSQCELNCNDACGSTEPTADDQQQDTCQLRKPGHAAESMRNEPTCPIDQQQDTILSKSGHEPTAPIDQQQDTILSKSGHEPTAPIDQQQDTILSKSGHEPTAPIDQQQDTVLSNSAHVQKAREMSQRLQMTNSRTIMRDEPDALIPFYVMALD